MRSVSKFGFSQVVVTFKDGTDIYFARQLINERLGAVELANTPTPAPRTNSICAFPGSTRRRKDGDLNRVAGSRAFIVGNDQGDRVDTNRQTGVEACASGSTDS
jgi:hypothetical protein